MPAVVVTVTFWVPEPAGAVAVREVAEATVTPLAAVVPKATVAPALKLVPVTVTVVPPAAGPEVGETPVTVGGLGEATAPASKMAPTAVDTLAGDSPQFGVYVVEGVRVPS